MKEENCWNVNFTICCRGLLPLCERVCVCVCVCVHALSPSVLNSQRFCSVLWMCCYFVCLKFFLDVGVWKSDLEKQNATRRTEWQTDYPALVVLIALVPSASSSGWRPSAPVCIGGLRIPGTSCTSSSKAFPLCRHTFRCGFCKISHMKLSIMYLYLVSSKFQYSKIWMTQAALHSLCFI